MRELKYQANLCHRELHKAPAGCNPGVILLHQVAWTIDLQGELWERKERSQIRHVERWEQHHEHPPSRK